MIIYMKNGLVIKTNDDLKNVRTQNGKIAGIDWIYKDGECLFAIDVEEIVAVTDDWKSTYEVKELHS